MPSSAEIMRTTQGWLRFRWPTFEIRELAILLLLVQFIANAELFAIAAGPRGFAAACAGLALVIYGGAACGHQSAVRKTVGWISSPWRYWLGTVVIGFVLGALVTTVTIASGRSTQIVEPVYNQILAVTLGPIVEEICLRGIMVSLLVRVMGGPGAVIATSVLFALMHWPASLLKLVCIGATGAVYGWIRVRSGSTALATLAHATHNFTVLVLGSVRA